MGEDRARQDRSREEGSERYFTLMAKRPPIGKCVHCLVDGVERTWDHVFPQAWYPDTTPRNLYKWQIPSCRKCNREYGEMEDNLLLLLAMCVDPNVPETSGIVEKALRSMKPEFAKNERDRFARAARAAWLHKELLNGSDICQASVFPGLGERWGRPSDQALGVRVPAISFKRLTEKIVRGIYFIDKKGFVEPPYAIEFYALTDQGAEPIKEIIERFGREYAREPGIVVHLAAPQEDTKSSIVEISVWGQFKMYASVTPQTVQDRGVQSPADRPGKRDRHGA